MENKINSLLIPNIGRLPSEKAIRERGEKSFQDDQFKKLLVEEIEEIKNRHGIEFSTHAAKRLKERNITMDSEEFLKLRGAIDKLKDKGGKDSLVITNSAAYIVDVDQGKIVTAIDKENMSENVFTKIDSTMFIN